ncbi:MAG: hypothetical protein H0V59_00715 [Nocardioidaceae bacterium]|nr:hypothetical protein [Nocardioidaceae bacterium]
MTYDVNSSVAESCSRAVTAAVVVVANLQRKGGIASAPSQVGNDAARRESNCRLNVEDQQVLQP